MALPQPQNVLLSGGSRGLGLSIVEHLLVSGHRVATFSRTRTQAIDRLSNQYADRFYYETANITDRIAVREFVQQMVQEFGTVDCLINNAAIASDGVLATTNDEMIGRQLDINLAAALALTRECIRQMLLQGTGNIINISSIVGVRGFAGLSVYSATKAAMLGATRALARELGSRGIRVNAITPGYLETEMSAELTPAQREQIVRRTPLGRLGTPSDIVPVVDFLLSDDSRFITGHVLCVDGGATA